MIIMLGVVLINTSDMTMDTQKIKLKLDIKQLENLTDLYSKRKSGNLGFDAVQFNTSTLSQAELAQFAGETITSNQITLYVIDLDKVDMENANFGKGLGGATDRYLYSMTTGKVYYEKGLVDNGKVYYYVLDGE